MTFDITAIVNAIIAALAAFITVFLVPWIRTKTTSQQREDLIAWIKIAVSAAEQMYKGDKRGEEKKQFVLDFLESNGFTVDDESVNAAIEAAVKQLNSVGVVIS
ncbi:MAG: phage holin, LLH family [Oscillospiraceae bacterium]|nr:phage holin, LLH family [Oscillospiraceae bacterium]